MKAADGTKIAEIVRYWTTCEDGIHGMDPAPQGKGNWVRYTDHLAALSAAEERERVLRGALEKQNRFLSCDEDADEYPTEGCKCEACTIQRLVDTALATPAPQQPAEKGSE